MGTHGRRGISHVMMGSVAEAVLRRAPCPILVLKSARFAPGHQRVMRMEPEVDQVGSETLAPGGELRRVLNA
jgi:hypothetical protein